MLPGIYFKKLEQIYGKPIMRLHRQPITDAQTARPGCILCLPSTGMQMHNKQTNNGKLIDMQAS